MTVDSARSMRELDRRQIDGIHVRLLWSELAVFRHPYAYDAWHRVDTRGDPALAGVALASA